MACRRDGSESLAFYFQVVYSGQGLGSYCPVTASGSLMAMCCLGSTAYPSADEEALACATARAPRGCRSQVARCSALVGYMSRWQFCPFELSFNLNY